MGAQNSALEFGEEAMRWMSGMIFLASLILNSCSAMAQNLTGGTTAQFSQFPWVVALVRSATVPFSPFCTGTIISANQVLTAAHCVDDGIVATDVFSVFGVAELTNSSARFERATQIEIHPKWVSSGGDTYYDQAVVTFSANVFPATAVAEFTSFWDSNVLRSGELITLGWGYERPGVKSPNLRYGIIRRTSCGAFGVGQTGICAGAPAIVLCSGDSGGPLAVRIRHTWYLLGVNHASALLCRLGAPSIFTPIDSDWLETVTGITPVSVRGKSCDYSFISFQRHNTQKLSTGAVVRAEEVFPGSELFGYQITYTYKCENQKLRYLAGDAFCGTQKYDDRCYCEGNFQRCDRLDNGTFGTVETIDDVIRQ